MLKMKGNEPLKEEINEGKVEWVSNPDNRYRLYVENGTITHSEKIPPARSGEEAVQNFITKERTTETNNPDNWGENTLSYLRNLPAPVQKLNGWGGKAINQFLSGIASGEVSTAEAIDTLRINILGNSEREYKVAVVALTEYGYHNILWDKPNQKTPEYEYVCMDCGNEQTTDLSCNLCFGWTFDEVENLDLMFGQVEGETWRDVLEAKPFYGTIETRNFVKRISEDYNKAIRKNNEYCCPTSTDSILYNSFLKPNNAKTLRDLKMTSNRGCTEMLESAHKYKQQGNLTKGLYIDAYVYRTLLAYDKKEDNKKWDHLTGILRKILGHATTDKILHAVRWGMQYP